MLQDAEKRGGAGRPPVFVEKLDLKPPKGTRDVFPEDMRLRNWYANENGKNCHSLITFHYLSLFEFFGWVGAVHC